MRIAITLPNWVGDVAMATPALRALHERFGSQTQLIGVLRPMLSSVLAGNPWLDREIHFDPRAGDRRLRFWNVVKQLRRAQPDIFLHLTNSFRGAVMGWMSGASTRVGFRRRYRGSLLTHELPFPREPLSYVDYCLAVTGQVATPSDDRRLQLVVTPTERQDGENTWRSLGISADDKVITLNTGGAYGAAKHWPAEYSAQLARRMAEELDAVVLMLCGPAERQVAAEVVATARHPRVVSLAEQKLGLGLSKACVQRSSLMISTDSGPRHFAAAFQVPSIALFGPTDPRWSDNYHPGEVWLNKQLSCWPCAKRECPLKHHRCMRDLTVDDVFRAAQAKWRADESKAA